VPKVEAKDSNRVGERGTGRGIINNNNYYMASTKTEDVGDGCNFCFVRMKPEHSSAIAAIQEAVYPTPYHEDIKFVMQRSLLFPPGSWVIMRKQRRRPRSAILDTSTTNTSSSNLLLKESSLMMNNDTVTRAAGEVSENAAGLYDSVLDTQQTLQHQHQIQHHQQQTTQEVSEECRGSLEQIRAGNDEGEMIGYMAAYPWPSTDALEKPPSLGDEKTVEMIERGASDPSRAHFFVHEVTLYAQGEGIGKLAMDFLLRIGKEMGFRQAMIVAVLGNESYWSKSCSFKELKKLPDGYYKRDEDKCESNDGGSGHGDNQKRECQVTNDTSSCSNSKESLSILINDTSLTNSSLSLVPSQKLEKRKSFFSTDWRVTVMTVEL